MMKKETFIWENETFRKDPYQVPEGYFAAFPDRMTERLKHEDKIIPLEYKRFWKPWMSWVSGAAAVLAIGWFGLHAFYLEPLKEVRFQEKIELFVDYYGQELQEGQLANYIEENNIDIKTQITTEVNALIQIEPDLAEQYIYESVGF